jgi:hypothetical protein
MRAGEINKIIFPGEMLFLLVGKKSEKNNNPNANKPVVLKVNFVAVKAIG